MNIAQNYLDLAVAKLTINPLKPKVISDAIYETKASSKTYKEDVDQKIKSNTQNILNKIGRRTDSSFLLTEIEATEVKYPQFIFPFGTSYLEEENDNISSLLNGFGKVSSLGLYYIGNWKNGEPHGFGQICFKDSTTYEGYWKAGKTYGHGKIFYEETLVYSGFWNKGIPTDSGALECQVEKNDDSMICIWKNIKLHRKNTPSIKFPSINGVWESNSFGNNFISNANLDSEALWEACSSISFERLKKEHESLNGSKNQ